jgi:anti-sigma regulatory factor (Ser/Thr protein kinase)
MLSTMQTYRASHSRGYGSVKQARLSLTAFAASCGFKNGTLDDVESAVGEALANAVEHGNRDTGFDVSATFDDGCLVIEVKDHGIGFDCEGALTSEAPDVHGTRGFGIFLMRQLMDEIAFSERGSRIQLVKRSSFSR